MSPRLLLMSLRLCRLWPLSSPTRFLTAATGQRSGPSNYYELLGVHPGASAEEVKRAFFTKSKELLGTPNAQYWAQFHNVRPQGPESRQQQSEQNQRVLGYCVLLMLAGMGLHYMAFRKLEQVHRSFMDEKDRIITAIYNDTRARARANKARILQEHRQRQQPGTPSLPPKGPEMLPRDNSR